MFQTLAFVSLRQPRSQFHVLLHNLTVLLVCNPNRISTSRYRPEIYNVSEPIFTTLPKYHWATLRLFNWKQPNGPGPTRRSRKRKFSITQKVFSTVHGPGPDGLVLVQATPRAEVDFIGVQRCEIARAIFR